MKFIFGYLRKYRLAVVVALLLLLIELIIELIQPLLIGVIIDKGIHKGDLQAVLFWSGILLLGSVLALGLGLLSSFYSAHVSQGFGYDVRERLYEKIQSFSYGVFQQFPQSSLITRLTSDVMQLQSTVFMALRIMLRAPLVVLGSIVMAFVVDWRLAIWLGLSVPFLSVFLVMVLRRGERLFSAVQRQLDRVNAVMLQSLSGMRLIRVYVREKHEEKRFDTESEGLMHRTIAAMRLTETTLPIILLVMNMSVVAVLWFGRAELDLSRTTVGNVVAVVNYATRTTMALSIMSMIIINFSRARASLQRIEEVMDSQDTLQDTVKESTGLLASPNKGLLSMEKVSYQYPLTDAPVLSGISFTALPGQTIAVMGATGAGKSTLLQLIMRLYDTDTGIVKVNGYDVRKLNQTELRSVIGYVPQETQLFSGTVAENIRFGKPDASMEEVVAAAKLAQIHDAIMSLPEQYESVVDQRGGNFSGGQRQRLTIARALVRRPHILLLDDSTSALDNRTERLLLEGIRDLSCTIVLVTQKVSATAAADQVLLLDDGSLIAKGTHEELLATSPLYQLIAQSQDSLQEEGA